LPGLAARALPPVGADAAPSLVATYERATRVNWRDSWENDATGVWVRGGHATDQHDHQDRGHVNFIARGKPILVEAGTPSYHHKLMMTHYTTGAGHNVLQTGTAFPEGTVDTGVLVKLLGWQKARCVAPLTVHQLDETGGRVLVDPTGCYDGLAKWHRAVTWTADELTVEDDVALSEGQAEVILFRWHLGTEESVVIDGDGERWRVAWPDARIALEASKPIAVTQLPMPDNTLQGHDGSENEGNVHTCIVVQTGEESGDLVLTTRVQPLPSPAVSD
jgi:hypothetical protein